MFGNNKISLGYIDSKKNKLMNEDVMAVWDFDIYLAIFLRDSLNFLADTGCSYPDNAGSFEEWSKILKNIADKFDFYVASESNVDNEHERADVVKKAMIELAEIFPELWD